jgi:hypothetical protein
MRRSALRAGPSPGEAFTLPGNEGEGNGNVDGGTEGQDNEESGSDELGNDVGSHRRPTVGRATMHNFCNRKCATQHHCGRQQWKCRAAAPA